MLNSLGKLKPEKLEPEKLKNKEDEDMQVRSTAMHCIIILHDYV